MGGAVEQWTCHAGASRAGNSAGSDAATLQARLTPGNPPGRRAEEGPWTRSVTLRRRCGEAGAPSPLRFGAAEWGGSIGRRARRLIGAPTAPPPPRCAIRLARVPHVCRRHAERAGDGLSSLHVPRRDEVRDEWDVACAALNLRRQRVLGVAAAQRL